VSAQLGHFVARDDSGAAGAEKDSDKIRRFRARYIGVVAEEIEAADGAIRLRDRGKDPATSFFQPPTKEQIANSTNDLVWVEGNLRILGNAKLCGSLDGADLIRFGVDENGSGRKVVAFARDATDEFNAGKIAYKPAWDPSVLGIVGAGVTGDRKIRMWDHVSINGNVGISIGTATPADTVEVGGNLRINTGSNPLRFTSSWTAFPDSTTNHAEICNDTNNFKTLMIVGNRSLGMGRRVSVWDRLEVNGTLQVTGRIGTGTFNADLGYPIGWGGGIHTWDVYAEGTVGVGTNGIIKAQMNASGDLLVLGKARKPGGGAWTKSSDARLKKKVAAITHPLERMLQLRGVQFEWKEPARMGNLTGQQMGLIAQEVEEIFPEWVSSDPEGYKELTIRDFEALTIEALRELHTQIEELKKRLDKIDASPPQHRERKKKEPKEKST
jgi:hypothetical protein